MKKLIYIGILLIGFLACDDILEVPDISNQQVEILAPTEGTSINDSIIRFNWNGVADAEGYLLQVARPDFENAIQVVVDTILVVDSTFVGTRFNTKLTNNTYEWRVKAFNSGFETDFTRSRFEVNY
jgi:hypothetical protein